MLLPIVFTVLSVLSFVLLLWQWLAGTQFPINRRTSNPAYFPAVTLLKPLKGTDAETRACLESWFQQDYPAPVQILFGVASPNDPVCELVCELIAANPTVNAQLVICSESLGPNAKVSSLIQLERRAENEIVIISDADVRVPKDLLREVVQLLEDRRIGLVNCVYKFANPSTTAMKWEAIAVNADFWSQVLQSQMLKPIDFALGAVMATRRSELKSIGGFESLVDYLADDYQLGHHIANDGKRIVLSPVVVECWEAPKTWGQIWNHQLRWARTIRVCQPAPFFFSILSNATLWPTLLLISLAITRNSLSGDVRFLAMPLLIFIPVRMFAALKLAEKLTGGADHYAYFWLIPVKDLLGAVIWALSFFGNTVEWRGEKFRVLSGGKLVRQ